jgi:hypothetical protein
MVLPVFELATQKDKTPSGQGHSSIVVALPHSESLQPMPRMACSLIIRMRPPANPISTTALMALSVWIGRSPLLRREASVHVFLVREVADAAILGLVTEEGRQPDYSVAARVQMLQDPENGPGRLCSSPAVQSPARTGTQRSLSATPDQAAIHTSLRSLWGQTKLARRDNPEMSSV